MSSSITRECKFVFDRVGGLHNYFVHIMEQEADMILQYTSDSWEEKNANSRSMQLIFICINFITSTNIILNEGLKIFSKLYYSDVSNYNWTRKF